MSVLDVDDDDDDDDDAGGRCPLLQHRYSFNDSSVTDSIGDLNGQLLNGAFIEDGQAVLNGDGAYVQLPPGLWSIRQEAVTIEVWMSTGASSGYPRLFEFGNSGAGDFGYGDTINFMLFMDPSTGLINTGYPTFVSSSETTARFGDQEYMHVVVALKKGEFGRLYVNGESVGVTAVAVDDIPIPNFFFIGKSFNSWDSYLTGSISELRVWRAFFSPNDAMTTYVVGPDIEDDILRDCGGQSIAHYSLNRAVIHAVLLPLPRLGITGLGGAGPDSSGSAGGGTGGGDSATHDDVVISSNMTSTGE